MTVSSDTDAVGSDTDVVGSDSVVVGSDTGVVGSGLASFWGGRLISSSPFLFLAAIERVVLEGSLASEEVVESVAAAAAFAALDAVDFDLEGMAFRSAGEDLEFE